MTDIDVIIRDPATGMFGSRLELGRDRNGTRMQARRAGFVTEQVALVGYRRLSRRRDANLAPPRLSDPVQTVCEDWLRSREQEL